MKNPNLYTLHLTFVELKDLISAMQQYREHLKSHDIDPAVAERVCKKASLLSDFARQRYTLSKAKEQVSKAKDEYDLFTFGSDPVDLDSEV